MKIGCKNAFPLFHFHPLHSSLCRAATIFFLLFHRYTQRPFISLLLRERKLRSHSNFPLFLTRQQRQRCKVEKIIDFSSFHSPLCSALNHHLYRTVKVNPPCFFSDGNFVSLIKGLREIKLEEQRNS